MKQIAIVEDEPLMREELETMLRKAGYETAEVCDFETAAEHLLQLSPDLILLDLNLPGASGFQICRSVKQKSSIPVLVLTSREQMKDELLALELGADEYLTKPCRKERLLARISNVLKRYEGRSNLLEGDGFPGLPGYDRSDFSGNCTGDDGGSCGSRIPRFQAGAGFSGIPEYSG